MEQSPSSEAKSHPKVHYRDPCLEPGEASTQEMSWTSS